MLFLRGAPGGFERLVVREAVEEAAREGGVSHYLCVRVLALWFEGKWRGEKVGMVGPCWCSISGGEKVGGRSGDAWGGGGRTFTPADAICLVVSVERVFVVVGGSGRLGEGRVGCLQRSYGWLLVAGRCELF